MLVRANAEKQSFSKTKAPKRGFVLWAQLDLNQRPGGFGGYSGSATFLLDEKRNYAILYYEQVAIILYKSGKIFEYIYL